MPDSTLVREIGIEPSSPIGQLLYPLMTTLVTMGVRLIKPIFEKYPVWSLRVGALVVGVLNNALVMGGGWSPSAIWTGVVLGVTAIGGWEIVVGPVLKKAGLLK